MKKGAGRVEGDDMLLVVEKVVVGGPAHFPTAKNIRKDPVLRSVSRSG